MNTDFFGQEEEVVEATDFKFGKKDIDGGFNLVTPHAFMWSPVGPSGKQCLKIIFKGEDYNDNGVSKGWKLPNGEDATCPIGTYAISDWATPEDWKTPTKAMIGRVGNNIISILHGMGGDVEAKFRSDVMGKVDFMNKFDKFITLASQFLTKQTLKCWIKVKREQKPDSQFFYYDICSNMFNKEAKDYRFIAINPAKVTEFKVDPETDIVTELKYKGKDDAIKTISWSFTNEKDNKVNSAIDNSMDQDSPEQDSQDSEDEIPF